MTQILIPCLPAEQTIRNDSRNIRTLSGLPSEALDKVSEYLFRQMYGMVVAVGIGKHHYLLHGIDVEDHPRVDDVCPSHSDEERLVGKLLVQQSHDRGEPVGHHEMVAGEVVYMGVVVVGLHIHHFVAVDDIELIVSAEADCRVHTVSLVALFPVSHDPRQCSLVDVKKTF